MTPSQIPMKETKHLREYPIFGVRIAPEYDDKLRRLRERGVDVATLIRSVIYEKLDDAHRQLFKK